MEISDAGHRPHAIHTGEEPRNDISYGPEALSVTLDTWGPQHNLFATMWNELQANWGESPERVERDTDLTPAQLAYVEKCFAGGTLPQVLEGITFWFTVDGVSRACTHQLVRTRIGAAMMQHGGRDNDWRHRKWTMPETIRRAIARIDGQVEEVDGLHHCLTDPAAVDRYLASHGFGQLEDAITEYLQQGRDLYAALVDAGIPWQDARRLLWMGTQTYIHINYNYTALRDVLANRLEHVMDWEINCVAQLMLREVRMKCPDMMSKYLGSHSDRQRRAVFSGLESWPPDQKYPTQYDPVKRTHTHLQMPFWILSEDAMRGGPVKWIPTNGVYPQTGDKT